MSDFSKLAPDQQPIIPPGTSAPLGHKSTLERIYERDQQPSGWQPIETAPKDGKRLILGWDDSASLPMHCEMGVFKGAKRWCNTYGHPFSGEPTHWMPLPAPPASASSKEAV